MLPEKDDTVLPKLLIVGAFPPKSATIFGGVITSCRLLLESSLPSKAQLILVDSTQISNPLPGLFVRAFHAALRVLRFLKAFERSRPDSVLLFSSPGASTFEKGLLAWYSGLRGTPALLFPRGGQMIDAAERSGFTRFWIRSVCRGATMILCQGPVWKKFAIETLGFSETTTPIITNWTATSRLLEIGDSRKMNLSDKPVELLFVGWVERNKGVVELIEAVRVLTRTQDIRLNIVGDGHSLAFLEEYVTTQKMESVVQFSGWLAGHDLEKAYQQADVLVLPSWAEGLPNAMIEAMAAKVAVVVSAVGNIPAIVSDGHDAMLIPPKNIEALVNALSLIIDNADLRILMAEAGHNLAKKEFAVETAVTRLLCAIDVSRNLSSQTLE